MVVAKHQVATIAIQRISELMALLEHHRIHAPGNCWCGECHEREASNTESSQP